MTSWKCGACKAYVRTDDAQVHLAACPGYPKPDTPCGVEGCSGTPAASSRFCHMHLPLTPVSEPMSAWPKLKTLKRVRIAVKPDGTIVVTIDGTREE